MKMLPLVNTDIPMPQDMMDALEVFEASRVLKQREPVSVDDVTSFLAVEFGSDLASVFKPNYLYPFNIQVS
tara:strand:- start:1700 stop:1912 length:213 start_codon:yes stop_codon:yes gene_type:complete